MRLNPRLAGDRSFERGSGDRGGGFGGRGRGRGGFSDRGRGRGGFGDRGRGRGGSGGRGRPYQVSLKLFTDRT